MEAFFVGQDLVSPLTKQAQEEGLDDVVVVSGAFDVRLQILDSNQLACGLDSSVRFDSKPRRPLMNKDPRRSELSKEVVKH